MLGNDKIIFAGPLRHKGGVGGVVVLFEDLVASLNPTVQVFDTNARNYSFSVVMVLKFFFCCLRASFKGNEISLHGSKRDYQYLGLILLLCHKLFRLRYHTRKFAGNFDEVYANFNFFWRWSTRKFLHHSRVNYFETQSLVQYFCRFNSKTLWFPNYRPTTVLRNSTEFEGRFIFIGHVKREKGLDEIIALGPLLPDGWLVDIYGLLIDYSPDAFKSAKIRYKGVLPADDVVATIAKYNVLILPTFHEGEGYPGAVLEAYSVSAPVVVTRWRALPELVDKSCGALVKPHDVNDLLRGMRDVAEHYGRKRIGAANKSMCFSKSQILNHYFSSIGVKGI